MEGEGGAPSAGAAAGGAGATTTTSPALLAIESQFDDVLDSINNIFVAAGDGELSKVQAFVASGVSVNSQDEYGYTPLYGCVAVAQWLLAQGALANIRDADGDTPLHHCEDTRCADLLVAAGADVAAVNAAGHCAYFVATWEHRAPMLEWFALAYQGKGLALPEVPPNPEEESMEYEEEEEEEEGGGGGGTGRVAEASAPPAPALPAPAAADGTGSSSSSSDNAMD